MAPDFQFATAWVVEIDGTVAQILVYLWTLPDADNDGELAYEARIKTWYQDVCMGFDFKWKEENRNSALEFTADVCKPNSDSRANVEQVFRNLLKDDGLEILDGE